MENVPQEKKEKEKKGGDPAPVENGEEARPVGGNESQKPEGNIRRGWALLSQDFRLVNNINVIDIDGDADDTESFTEKMRELNSGQ